MSPRDRLVLFAHLVGGMLLAGFIARLVQFIVLLGR